MRPPGRARVALKRALDLGLGVPLLGALLPGFALIAVAIKMESPGPVFFGQRRRGLGYRPMRVLKFRTLRHDAPDPYEGYEMAASDPRITRVGRLLRRSSLDELPQLLHVVAGTMSLVGPRPLDDWESARCLVEHADRFFAAPGMTGLAQVNGRNRLPFTARADLDVEYARRFSAWLDLAILFRTPRVLWSGDGLYPERPAREDSTRWEK